jgi:peroxiredoxin family protein
MLLFSSTIPMSYEELIKVTKRLVVSLTACNMHIKETSTWKAE